ncbi:MAG: translation initiation factor IF-3 [Holosporales bacterium]|nr:translation initiation factor IF-3 [Holosporales bacterium]
MVKGATGKRPETNQLSTFVNDGIEASEVRLIGIDGEVVGIVPIEKARDIAEKAELDLVVVSMDSVPPVCKILDYGKYRYEMQKKKTESKKKQKNAELKEIQVRPSIGENDLLIKCKAIKRFIDAGDKVKLVLRFKGRELTRKELGHEVIRKVLEYSRDFAKEESPAKLEGFVITAILAGK